MRTLILSFWVSIALGGLVGFAGLWSSKTSFAQDQGFTPPGKNFGTNPFNQQNPDGGFFDEEDDFEEDEFDDIAEDVLRQKMEQRLKERAKSLREGADNNSNNAAQASPSRSAPKPRLEKPKADFKAMSDRVGNTSIQSGANSKITPGPNSAGCLSLDPSTGYGPDVISNFDFPDADIIEIAKTLGRLTCLNFIFDMKS